MLTILLIELYKTQLSWFLLFQRIKHTFIQLSPSRTRVMPTIYSCLITRILSGSISQVVHLCPPSPRKDAVFSLYHHFTWERETSSIFICSSGQSGWLSFNGTDMCYTPACPAPFFFHSNIDINTFIK